MKRFLSRAWRVVKTIWGITAGVFTLIFIIMCFADRQQWGVYAVMAAVFGLLAVLLLRKKKPKTEHEQVWVVPVDEPPLTVSFVEREVPEEALRDMRMYYSQMQADNDARILAESFQLCQQTYNYETFFHRLELAQRCALTLLQAKKAKCPINAKTVKACESALSAVDALKIDFLDRVYTRETKAALQLKTKAGQRRRLEALLDGLQEHDDDFMSIDDTYQQVLQSVRDMIAETEKAGEV